MPTDSNDIFQKINNAVLDLQSAQLQTYDRPLKVLARLLHHADLEPTNARLTEGLDLDTWLKRQRHGGSMVGSARLDWPASERECLGLTLLLIDQFAAKPNSMMDFGHTYFYTGRKIIGDIQAVVGQLIIPFVRDYRAYVHNRELSTPRLAPQVSSRVFIVHGHDEAAREMVARYLQQAGLQPVILHEQPNKGMTIIEKIEANGAVGFAVVLLTPDDEGCAKGGHTRPRARQNVVLELGYFVARLGRDRVCALLRGDVEIPSDFTGVVWTPMDSGGAWKQALARELKAAGYNVDLNSLLG